MSENAVYDALKDLAKMDPSPSFTVLKDVTADKPNGFILRHEPMAAPPLPMTPPLARAGRRAHVLETLTDTLRYVREFNPTPPPPVTEPVPPAIPGVHRPRPVAFYSNSGAQIVIDEDSQTQKEVVRCTLARSPAFQIWLKQLNGVMPQEAFMDFLRKHTGALDAAEPESAIMAVSAYASLTGTLTHGAEDYLDAQSKSAAFTVRRKVRGQAEPGDNDTEVPTEFKIAVKILPDDPALTQFKVLVRMTGSAGAAVMFCLSIENLETIVNDHIDARLAAFSESAGFLCVRGEYKEEPWAEPELPKSVVRLMELQAKQMRAATGGPPLTNDDN